MAKYSFESRKKIVSEYLSGNKSPRYLARKYGITNKRVILNWAAIYKTLGDDGLIRSRKNEDVYVLAKKISTDTSELKYYDVDDKVGWEKYFLCKKNVGRVRINYHVFYFFPYSTLYT
ncbi:helix-turn-helix domain-containing protein [Peptostreptococcus sp. D1]|uniref:helix-turn-helix domain-containing protein n=1 Tax=Peptostreptococcus sp. D1 TaxID=72304 RepID=UPI0008E62A87|nr:helix-turn-helix domain-containing protein [Peptostreptococcus sp. D1]SFE21098.1 Helix-turn-helix domain-containing protein [Peptostreptococcus sp. D1]